MMILDDWQKEILDYDGNILLCTGRQVGKTTIMAIKAAEYMIKHKGSKIIIVSLTEDQAKLIIVMILDYIEKHYSKDIASGRDKPTQNKITIKNGSSALARPVGNTGDAVRGFTGDVLIIDEAARMPALAFQAAMPVLLTTAGQIWMCSTPFGKTGYFYKSFLNKERYKVWHKNSEEVINNREISKDWSQEKKDKAIEFLRQEKHDMTGLQYGQEYLAMFLDDLRRFFDDDLIMNCCRITRPESCIREDNYMGVDLARMGNDESSFEILHVLEDGKIRQIENITTKKKMTTETELQITELARVFNCLKVGIDAGSGTLGVGIYDHLLDSELKRKVVAMNNRQISLTRNEKNMQRIFKEDMYDNLKAMMEHHEILLLDDENLCTSLRSIQFQFNKDEAVRENRVSIFGNYSHIAEGLIRAAWLAKKERNKKFFIHYI